MTILTQSFNQLNTYDNTNMLINLADEIINPFSNPFNVFGYAKLIDHLNTLLDKLGSKFIKETLEKCGNIKSRGDFEK